MDRTETVFTHLYLLTKYLLDQLKANQQDGMIGICPNINNNNNNNNHNNNDINNNNNNVNNNNKWDLHHF